MDIKLIRFEKEHLRYLEYWEKDTTAANPALYDCSIQDTAAKNPSFFFMVKVAGRIIGCTWFEQIDDAKKEVRLALHLGEKKFLSKASGEQLIKLVLNKAFYDLSFTKVSLFVREKDLSSLNCYRKCGFRITEKSLAEGTDGLIYEMALVKSRFRR